MTRIKSGFNPRHPRSTMFPNMHHALIQRIVEELRKALPGRFFGKIFQLMPVSFAFDFGLRGEFLFVSVDPASPRLYLIRRRTKDLDKQSIHLTAFGQFMRSRLGGAFLVDISKDPLDRIVRLTFRIDDETGPIFRRVVFQLTGRTADIFVLDELNRIMAVLREGGQTRMHAAYQPPPRPQKESRKDLNLDAAQLDCVFHIARCRACV